MSKDGAVDRLIEMLLEGTATPQVKLAAARGALPLPRPAMVQLHVMLKDDADETIRTEAAKNLAALDRDSIAEVLGDGNCVAAVQEHFASVAAKDELLADKIAYHSGASLKAVATLA